MVIPVLLAAAGLLGGSFFATKYAEQENLASNERVRRARQQVINEELKRKEQQNKMSKYLSSGSLGVQTRRNLSIDRFTMASMPGLGGGLY